MKRPVTTLMNGPAALKKHSRILVAVSGGGDSVAMLSHFLTSGSSKAGSPDFHVATVDHRLRPESADEAKFVSALAKQLGVEHATLKWKQAGNASSAYARDARYDLLTRHALKIGATAIALAHTLDDQAETILMRAQRMNADSGTRGLAGMPELATHAISPGRSVCLWRPFLGMRRSELRAYLVGNDIAWVDDPSNDDRSYERIQARSMLDEATGLPTREKLAQLAKLSSRSRLWLNRETGLLLEEHLTAKPDGSLFLSGSKAPLAIIENAFASLVSASGGLEHRPAPDKLNDLCKAYRAGEKLRRNVGRALITTSFDGAHFERENRNRPDAPDGCNTIIDGRFHIDDAGKKLPFIIALERFRPACDDPIYQPILTVLSQSLTPMQQSHVDIHQPLRST